MTVLNPFFSHPSSVILAVLLIRFSRALSSTGSGWGCGCGWRGGSGWRWGYKSQRRRNWVTGLGAEATRGGVVAASGGEVVLVGGGQGGTLAYEDQFDVLSLSRAFVPNENLGAKAWSGGMSVSLAGPNRRVLKKSH
ncbi:hypothetical protein L2E82_20444 [Cichorium intybus]|uniref:Uncharacterized protein n=1 Tax=Cichorium intybus TaxID=13427 RepID=A0ACB9DT21_CICIN|nr:hypothetical protein L2E82_20444 [Cichorium intybus]